MCFCRVGSLGLTRLTHQNLTFLWVKFSLESGYLCRSKLVTDQTRATGVSASINEFPGKGTTDPESDT